MQSVLDALHHGGAETVDNVGALARQIPTFLIALLIIIFFIWLSQWVTRIFRRGERFTDIVPLTIADGLRGTIGAINFALMREHVDAVLPVDEAQIVAAMRLIWERLKQVVEPSSATVLAAILRHPQHFAGKRVGIVLSGGNVDLDALPWLS